MADHIVHVLPTCRHIMDLARTGKYIGDFPKGTYGRVIVDAILSKARTTL